VKSYLSVASIAERETVIERSRFIAVAAPAEDEAAAEALITRIKKRHTAATHNCYGYIADMTGTLMRFSDDGEPSGTAGMPILDAIRGRGLRRAAVVVTRYFGGIKLGAGGLVRAYRSAALSALDEAGQAEYFLCRGVTVTVDYSLILATERALARFNTADLRKEYGTLAKFSVYVAEEQAQALADAAADATLGKAQICMLGQKYLPL